MSQPLRAIKDEGKSNFKKVSDDSEEIAVGREFLVKLFLNKPYPENKSLDSSPLFLATDKTGGIDFRFLPIVTQAINNLSLNTFRISLSRLDGINLNQEWLQIQELAEAGITPSTERIKEYIQVSCLKDKLNDMRKVISCIADILRAEEESCSSTDPTLRDILVVLESGRSIQELKAVFTGSKANLQP